MSTPAVFGRYWPADSPLHRLDPRTKILGSIALLVIVFCAGTYPALLVCAALMFALFACAHVPAGQALKSIAPLLFIIVITALLNLLFVQGGTVYASAGPLAISQAGVHAAVFLSIRLALLLLSGSLLTMTTTTLDISDGFERLLAPLARFGVPAHELSLVVGIALRFLPQFVDELHTIRAAQESRGGGLAARRGGASRLTSLIIPLFTSAFRHANTLSSAMEARCYHGAVGRTRLCPIAFARRDGVAAAVLAASLAVVIAVTALT